MPPDVTSAPRSSRPFFGRFCSTPGALTNTMYVPPPPLQRRFPCSSTDLHAHVKPDRGILDMSQFGNVLRLETIAWARTITDGGDVHTAHVKS